MNSHEIKYLRPEQIREEMQKVPLAYLPVGPLEWHGPHLPYGTDPLNAESAALRAAAQTGGLVFPTLYFGTERERTPEVLDWLGLSDQKYIVGMDFPANSLPSAYCSEEVFALLIREQLRLLVRLGFRLAMLISGHGATNHLEVLHRLAAEYSAETPLRVLVAIPFAKNEEGVLVVGHASRVETAIMQSLYPDLVAVDRLPAPPEPLKNADFAVVDWQTFGGDPTPERTIHADDDPRLANPDQGRQTAEKAVRQIVAQVKQALAELR
ncbi:MAG TPA: creatininase family protein [Anaerolineaceae bacterium]|nr:creatininase family protein [Anaerolineaceae bacterium]